MEHLNDASRHLKPGVEVEKSVGSGTSEERKFILFVLATQCAIVNYITESDASKYICKII